MKSEMLYKDWKEFIENNSKSAVPEIIKTAKNNAKGYGLLDKFPIDKQIKELFSLIPVEEFQVYNSLGKWEKLSYIWNDNEIIRLHPDWEPPERELIGWSYLDSQKSGTELLYKHPDGYAIRFLMLDDERRIIVILGNSTVTYRKTTFVDPTLQFALDPAIQFSFDNISAKNSTIIYEPE